MTPTHPPNAKRSPIGGGRTFPLVGLAVLAFLTVTLSAGGLHITWRNHRMVEQFAKTDLEIRSRAGRIMHYDELLTMSAKMSAATADPRWEARYRKYDPLLVAEIDALSALAPEHFVGLAAQETAAANRALVDMENRAFELVRSERSAEAAILLESEAYQEQKDTYADGMKKVVAAIASRADAALSAQRDQLENLTFAAAVVLLAVIALWARLALTLRSYLRDKTEAERALEAAAAELEARVEERTAELRRAGDELTREVNERLRVQSELQQAQKLEAVGRLAAGIAHEINTPVQFVSDSAYFLQDAVKDLLLVIDRLVTVNRSVLEGAPSQAAAAEAGRAVEAAELPYLVENVPKAIERALDGLSRVASLVRSMKEFAHPDSKEMVAVDLNRAIQSTLTIARNEYKFVAELETDFGELPPVLCLAGELNQAVLNIVVNAAQAIGDVADRGENKGRITVRTRRDGTDAVVTIADTGGGIPDAIRGRIFEPFFTTKEVGKGTGQGLSIARSVIVDRHGGRLTFETEVGSGTTFFIRVPISGGAARAPTAQAAA
ncbi:MAG: hypothetical protein IT384_10205 [Deltaproteobacteria bacterium]|nr:hypothetical protein [Deltaproteobacteria bacterium]